MLLFGHTGITLLMVGLSHLIFFRISLLRKKSTLLTGVSSTDSINCDPSVNSKKWPVDYRIVLLGSMFPDIVDKPLGMLIFANLIANGRIYTHTLLVSFIFVLIGIYFLSQKRPNFLVFALSSCFHLILDEMWLEPRTLFWPLYGWGFPKGDLSHWWKHIFYVLFTNPRVYVPEVIGAVILITFGLTLIKRKTAGKFLSKGATG